MAKQLASMSTRSCCSPQRNNGSVQRPSNEEVADSSQEFIDVDGDSNVPFSVQPEIASRSDMSRKEMNSDEDQNQLVMRIRRITTPAYALKRIDGRMCSPDYSVRMSYPSSPMMHYALKKEQELAPNPNSSRFMFTGHQHLYPYRFYLDLIKRAKRDPSLISLDMPKLRPAGGTIVIYDCNGVDQNRALHNDGYRWGRSKGVKLIQSVGNKLVRTYHFLYDPNNPAGDPSFKKYRFSLRGENYGIMVMHYIGDEKHAAEVSARCMRNSDPAAMLAYSEARQGVEEIQELNLSVLPVLSEQCSEEECSRYRDVLLENIKMLQAQLLYENGETFVEGIEYYDAGVSSVVLYCYPLIDQLVAVTGYLQQGTLLRSIQLLYHTEPISVQYSLSTLAFIHPFFESDQVLPVAFMVNSTPMPERSDCHDNFLSAFYERFRELLSGRYIIITGHNVSLRQDSFPIAKHVQCWENFKKVKLNYIETHFGQSDLREYSSDMSILMNCSYENLFNEMWSKISTSKRYTEHPELYSYFENAWNEFKNTNSTWHLKACGVLDIDKGVTWRPCKNLCKVVAHLSETDAEVDAIILSLFLLSNAFRRLFIAGLHQSGAWRLKKCYRERFQQSHLKLPKLPYAPTVENIVPTAFSMCPGRHCKRVMNSNVDDLAMEGTMAISSLSSQESCLNGSPEFSSYHQSSLSWDSAAADDNTTNETAEGLVPPLPCFRSSNVKLIGAMTFCVRGRDNQLHIVEGLQCGPSESLQWFCSCGLGERCIHITSAIEKVSEEA